MYEKVTYHIRDMGLEESWTSKSSGTYYRAGSGGRGGEGGSGDSSGGPLPERIDRKVHPTLLIEASYAQTLEDMQEKA